MGLSDRLRVIVLAGAALASVATSRAPPRQPTALAAGEVSLRTGCAEVGVSAELSSPRQLDVRLVSRGSCRVSLAGARVIDRLGDRSSAAQASPREWGYALAFDVDREAVALELQLAAPDGTEGAWRVPLQGGRAQPPEPIEPFAPRFANPP